MVRKPPMDIISFIENLEVREGFFDHVMEINRYNIDAITELIQYKNVKEYGHPIYTKREIRSGLKKYFTWNQQKEKGVGENETGNLF